MTRRQLSVKIDLNLAAKQMARHESELASNVKSERKPSLVYVPPGETRNRLAAEFIRPYMEHSEVYPQIFQRWLVREWLAEEKRTAWSVQNVLMATHIMVEARCVLDLIQIVEHVLLDGEDEDPSAYRYRTAGQFRADAWFAHAIVTPFEESKLKGIKKAVSAALVRAAEYY
jgi:hypothetical protein